MESTKQLKLTFLGGAQTVTGSKTLITTENKNVLIDCGLFQGLKELRLLNRAPFPVEPTTIDAIIITHAHLDHCGHIPLLVKNGFQGDIHCTEATAALIEIILKDSAKIQEEDAERANRYHYTKHKFAEPLYTQVDVKKALDMIVIHNYEQWVFIDETIKFEFLNNGHILGSGLVNMVAGGKKIVFSGDLGRLKPMLLYPPKKVHEADYIIMESTYGDREHPLANVKKELQTVIDETFANRGILLIPSFAVERTQELLYLIYQLRKEGKLPHIPVYLDSPMGTNVTEVYDKFHELQNISSAEINEMYEDVQFISDAEESKAVCLDNRPKIVLAGSGMIEGGRILHYLNNHIDDPKNTLLIVGYQGEGTRGRAIVQGSKQIKFFGKYREVRCQIRNVSALSAHADCMEITEWLRGFDKPPVKIFLNHGEAHQTDALRLRIEFELEWNVVSPKMNESFELI